MDIIGYLQRPNRDAASLLQPRCRHRTGPPAPATSKPPRFVISSILPLTALTTAVITTCALSNIGRGHERCKFPSRSICRRRRPRICFLSWLLPPMRTGLPRCPSVLPMRHITDSSVYSSCSHRIRTCRRWPSSTDGTDLLHQTRPHPRQPHAWRSLVPTSIPAESAKYNNHIEVRYRGPRP